MRQCHRAGSDIDDIESEVEGESHSEASEKLFPDASGDIRTKCDHGGKVSGAIDLWVATKMDAVMDSTLNSGPNLPEINPPWIQCSAQSCLLPVSFPLDLLLWQ